MTLAALDERRQRIMAAPRAAGIRLQSVRTDDGLELAVWYKPSVRPSRRALLLLHGLTYSSMSVFDLLVPAAPRGEFSAMLRFALAGIDVYAVDMEGYGLSESRGGCTPLHRYCADVAQVAHWISDRSGLRPAVLGWSCGALTAARVATDASSAISACVFYGSFWGGGQAGRPANSREINIPPGERRVNSHAHAQGDFVTTEFYDASVRSRFAERALEIDASSPIAYLHHMAAGDPLFDPREIAVPFLAIRGSHDRSSTAADMHELLARIPHDRKRFAEVPRSDHVAHMQHCRNAFYETIARFLDEAT